MAARPDALLLWGRAVVLAAVTFLVGAVGHVTSGGLLPGVPVLVLLLGVGTAVAAAFLGRPASTRLLVLLVAGGQTLVHAALSLTAGHAGHAGHAGTGQPVPAFPAGPAPSGAGSLPTDAGGRVGSLQDHYEAMTGAPPATGLAVPDPTALLDHLPMFLAHAGAGACVGLWLAVGERAVWALLALALHRTLAPLRLLRATTPARRPRPHVGHRHPAHRPSRERVARSVVRRGPPLLLAS